MPPINAGLMDPSLLLKILVINMEGRANYTKLSSDLHVWVWHTHSCITHTHTHEIEESVKTEKKRYLLTLAFLSCQCIFISEITLAKLPYESDEKTLSYKIIVVCMSG